MSLSGEMKFVKNAVSNLISGGSSAVLAVVLPYFFVRTFTPPEFSLWVLVLQLAAYVNFLNFGVQIAVGRYVSHALSRGDRAEAENILSAGVQILGVLACVAFVLIVLLAQALPYIFPKVDPTMVETARIMLFWIGGALTVGLPASAYLGVFVGLQRNDIPALISLVSKAGLALALIFVAQQTHSLKTASVTYFVVSMLGYLLQYVLYRYLCPTWRTRMLGVLPAARKELISYCLSLSVWSIAMLLVNGISTTVVGIFDFKNVGAFGVALNLIAFFVGLFRAILAPLLQVFTKLFAKGEIPKLIDLFRIIDCSTSIMMMFVCYWMILPAHWLFGLWLGPDLAAVSLPIFIVLVIGNTARNTASVYAYYLLAVGQQRKIYSSPIAEGISNFFASITGGWLFGAFGVAWGVMIGAVVGLSANYFYNFPRTMPQGFSVGRQLHNNILKPILVTTPMLAVAIFGVLSEAYLYWTIPLMILAMGPSLWTLWQNFKAIRSGSLGASAGLLMTGGRSPGALPVG